MPKKLSSWFALFLFALVLVIIAYLAQTIFPNLVYQGIYLIILFFLLLTLFTHYITRMGLKHAPDKFALVYLGTMTFRLLISIGIILIVLLQEIPDRINFVIHFSIVYLAFLIFEIYALLTTLRSNFQTRAENADKKQQKLP
ncbi:signal transduction histidine kinase [Catalinimonas alkaloidigena]|uniref:hypothetical protein n=1 Tax=Catalinimonas alkaloidigena TaxID=1075417 RepID=UPI002405E643|nr:hypothetical protein [Catalinimonas alkaloidigena]MDF9798304.1 signal transduction histidine kinase [Catalinimonas alkaloidigena]